MQLIDIILISGAVICFAGAFFIASSPAKLAASKREEKKIRFSFSAEENNFNRNEGSFSELHDETQ